MLPLVVILSTNVYLNFQKKFDDIHLYSDVERHHRMLQLLLSDQDICKNSLKQQVSEYTKDTSTSLKIKDGSNEHKYLKQLREGNGQDTIQLKHIGFKDFPGDSKIFLQADQFERNTGYVTLKFEYMLKNESIIKYHKLYVEKKEFEESGSIYQDIERCINIDSGFSCPADASFLTSFDESSLSPSSRESTGDTPEPEGTELIRSFSNTSMNARGLNCVSHAICNAGEWKPRALCYNSCTNKFWMDGLTTPLNETDARQQIDSSEEKLICKASDETTNEGIFTIPKDCGGKSLHTVRVEEPASFGKRVTLYSEGNATPEGLKSELAVQLECSYLGTWILKRLWCSDPHAPNDANKNWKVDNPKESTDPQFTCSTAGNTMLVTSTDGTKNKEIELSSVYSGKFLIGEPRRMAVLFENSPTSVSFYCKKSNLGGRAEWTQVETTKYCGEAPAGETTGQVDIMFAIDESGSMGEEIVKVKNDIEDFLRSFINGRGRDLDWRIIVDDRGYIQKDGTFYKRTNLGSDESSTHLTTSRLISPTPTTEQFVRAFRDQLMPIGAVLNRLRDGGGIDDGSSSRKVDTSRGWVKWDYDNAVTARGVGEKYYAGIKYAHEDAGLFRRDAHLAIVVVTDDGAGETGVRDAQWRGRDLSNTVVLHNYLLSIKGGDSDKLAGVYGVVPLNPGPGCNWENDLARNSTNLQAIINRTGGETYDLCASDYSRDLQDIADKVIERVLQVIGI